MRRYLVAANWKMNGTRAENEALIQGILAELPSGDFGVLVSVPFVYLEQVADLVKDSAISLAAQNVSEFEKGAYTGEVSAQMLADLNCQYALVGHSERRQLFGDSDEKVLQKFKALQQEGITPILCLGETLEQREADQTESVVSAQLKAVTDHLGVAAFEKAVIAYEPVWAIGTGKTASPEQAQAVHQFLRSELAKLDSNVADKVQILYGGSVNENSAAELFAQNDIDGGLIGGASLKADSFLNICKVVGRG